MRARTPRIHADRLPPAWPPRWVGFDEMLAWVIAGLIALGLVMVYSSSIAIAEGSRITGRSYHR